MIFAFILACTSDLEFSSEAELMAHSKSEKVGKSIKEICGYSSKIDVNQIPNDGVCGRQYLEMRLYASPEMDSSEVLYLPGVSALSKEEASIIQNLDGKWLNLPNLKMMDADIALRLFSFKGPSISLNQVSGMDEGTAKVISSKYQHGTTLSLNGLRSVDIGVAEELKTWKGQTLYLNGITSMNSGVAYPLSNWSGQTLYLNGLTSIDSGVAGDLNDWSGQTLYLNGLTSIQVASAERLKGKSNQTLFLDGLQSINAGVAIAFKDCQYDVIYMRGLEEMDATLRNELDAASCKIVTSL